MVNRACRRLRRMSFCVVKRCVRALLCSRAVDLFRPSAGVHTGVAAVANPGHLALERLLRVGFLPAHLSAFSMGRGIAHIVEVGSQFLEYVHGFLALFTRHALDVYDWRVLRSAALICRR